MARDFTVSAYVRLLDSFREAGYAFQPLCDFIRSPQEKVVILRHDVDRYPLNSLRTALAENKMDITGTYFFRCRGGKSEEEIIKQISQMGHEAGYHYEDLSKAKGERRKVKGGRPLKNCPVGNFREETGCRGGFIRRWGRGGSDKTEEELVGAAFESFSSNLAKLRKIVPVHNICMHGSPTSRFDSRLLWKYYDYRDLGVEAEPYFDICFEDILYLTDTGRRWNGASVSLRDRNSGLALREPEYFAGWKVKPLAGSLMNMTDSAKEFQAGYRFRSTNDIVFALESGEMPQKIMITFHPQRWSDKIIPWAEELLLQNIKNPIKYFIVLITAKRTSITGNL